MKRVYSGWVQRQEESISCLPGMHLSGTIRMTIMWRIPFPGTLSMPFLKMSMKIYGLERLRVVWIWRGKERMFSPITLLLHLQGWVIIPWVPYAWMVSSGCGRVHGAWVLPCSMLLIPEKGRWNTSIPVTTPNICSISSGHSLTTGITMPCGLERTRVSSTTTSKMTACKNLYGITCQIKSMESSDRWSTAITSYGWAARKGYTSLIWIGRRIRHFHTLTWSINSTIPNRSWLSGSQASASIQRVSYGLAAMVLASTNALSMMTGHMLFSHSQPLTGWPTTMWRVCWRMPRVICGSARLTGCPATTGKTTVSPIITRRMGWSPASFTGTLSIRPGVDCSVLVPWTVWWLLTRRCSHQMPVMLTRLRWPIFTWIVKRWTRVKSSAKISLWQRRSSCTRRQDHSLSISQHSTTGR